MDEEILETAKSICACGAEDEALLKRLCAASAQALERELREGVAPEDCEGAFICASAWLAAAALTDARLGGAEELSSLRAGDVTIEVRGGANSERAAGRGGSALLALSRQRGGECGAGGPYPLRGKALPRPPRGEREARRSGDALLGGA